MDIIDFDEDSLKDFYKIVSINVIRIRKENKLSQLKLANAIGHNNATFIGKAELNEQYKNSNKSTKKADTFITKKVDVKIEKNSTKQKEIKSSTSDDEWESF